MTLKDITYSENFHFESAGELLTWLTQFNIHSDEKPGRIDLDTVLFDERLDFVFETERLSDGSEVHNIRIRS